MTLGLALAGAAAAPACADPPPFASDARVAGDSKKTRFIADLSEKVELSAFILGNPYRVIIDLPETRFKFDANIGKSGRGLVRAWRYGLFAPGKSRIVLDLSGPARIDKAFVIPATGDQPARLVVDMVKTTLAAFRSRQAQQNLIRRKLKLAHADESGNDAVAKKTDTRPVVVIDPGHGGLDTGAIGREGTNEKDVVLAFSRALRDALEKNGRYAVVLTRDTDTFLPLGARVKFARNRHADLMISIHADSVRQKFVRGATVYTQSENASDAVAHEIAERENKSDVIAGVELEEEPPVVGDILIDLTRRETRNFSIFFARTLVRTMKQSRRMNKNPHRSAGFVVLRAHDVPSVLLELGYLTNGKDEKLLADAQWQEKMAADVVLAIDSYFQVRIAAGNE